MGLCLSRCSLSKCGRRTTDGRGSQQSDWAYTLAPAQSDPGPANDVEAEDTEQACRSPTERCVSPCFDSVGDVASLSVDGVDVKPRLIPGSLVAFRGGFDATGRSLDDPTGHQAGVCCQQRPSKASTRSGVSSDRETLLVPGGKTSDSLLAPPPSHLFVDCSLPKEKALLDQSPVMVARSLVSDQETESQRHQGALAALGKQGGFPQTSSFRKKGSRRKDKERRATTDTQDDEGVIEMKSVDDKDTRAEPALASEGQSSVSVGRKAQERLCAWATQAPRLSELREESTSKGQSGRGKRSLQRQDGEEEDIQPHTAKSVNALSPQLLAVRQNSLPLSLDNKTEDRTKILVKRQSTQSILSGKSHVSSESPIVASRQAASPTFSWQGRDLEQGTVGENSPLIPHKSLMKTKLIEHSKPPPFLRRLSSQTSMIFESIKLGLMSPVSSKGTALRDEARRLLDNDEDVQDEESSVSKRPETELTAGEGRLDEEDGQEEDKTGKSEQDRSKPRTVKNGPMKSKVSQGREELNKEAQRSSVETAKAKRSGGDQAIPPKPKLKRGKSWTGSPAQNGSEATTPHPKRRISFAFGENMKDERWLSLVRKKRPKRVRFCNTVTYRVIKVHPLRATSERVRVRRMQWQAARQRVTRQLSLETLEAGSPVQMMYRRSRSLESMG